MNNIVRSLALAGLVLTFAIPANADSYVSSYQYKVNGMEAPSRTVLIDNDTKVLTQSAIVGDCSAVRVQSAVVTNECPTAIRTTPVVVENLVKKKSHMFHINLWPLVDFSLF